MKIIKNLKFAALAALVTLAVTLLFQIPPTRAFAGDKTPQDNGHTLHLEVVFNNFHSTQADPNVAEVGDQYTYGATLASFQSPDRQIGTFGVHFVVTAPESPEWLGNGCLNLPDGKISIQMLLGPSDWAGDKHGAITGGTGTYRNARGEIIHHSRAGGGEEFILNFVGN